MESALDYGARRLGPGERNRGPGFTITSPRGSRKTKMKMKTKTTLKNDFHGTTCSVRVAADGVLTTAQMRRVEKTLCGMEDCRCGTIRGGQDGIGVLPWQDAAGRPTWKVVTL